MSWYRLAQSWYLDEDADYMEKGRDFSDIVENIYELSYKYGVMTNPHTSFHGHPKRKNNLLKLIDNKLKEYLNRGSEALKPVFEKWLGGHALTNTDEWVNSRYISQEDMGDPLHVASGELIHNIMENRPKKKKKLNNGKVVEFQDRDKVTLYEISKFLNDELSTNIDKYPTIKTILLAISEEERQSITDEISGLDEDEDEYREELEERLSNVNDVGSLINSFIDLSFAEAILAWANYSDYTLVNFDYIDGATEEDLARDIYRLSNVPWLKTWIPRGIEKTRERVESAYKGLINIPSLSTNDAASAFNIALNVVHQSGNILDYTTDYGGFELDSDFLKRMSELDTTKWDRELEEVGFVQ